MAAVDTSLHQGFLLHSTADEYILQPNSSGRALVFNRNTGDIRLNPAGSPPVQTDKAGKIIYGLFGVVPLPTSELLRRPRCRRLEPAETCVILTADVLVLITSAKSRGKLLGHPIYLASGFLLLPVCPDNALTPTDGKLISLIWKHLQDGKFWFSYEWDLTRRLQAQASPQSDPAGNVNVNAGARAMWEMADDRFFWNKHLHSMLIRYGTATGEREISRFILPVIYGFFDLRTSVIQSHPVQFALISRRSRYRAGTRYFTRGVDSHGNPGNFNESEQIFISTPPGGTSTQPSVASFVQTRGSAPFYWAEIVNLIRVPDLIVMDKAGESHDAFRKHVDWHVGNYGRALLLNLVKSKGREKHVKDAYEDLVFGEKEKEESEKMDVEGDGEGKGVMSKVDYVHFDLHTETAGDKWHRVDDRTRELGRTLEDYGYFEAGPNPQAPPVKLQAGVVRTNCMDCLDRTNLMQTSIAKRAMNQQAHDFGLIPSSEMSIDAEEEFIKMFREVWSDHGNFIATAYTGTGALRTDFTRTGVRTKKGVVLDKMTSGWRYILNNHADGYKQDAFDLMTGAWQPHGDPGEAVVLLHDKRHWAVPYLFWFSLVMILFTLALRRTSCKSFSVLYPLTLYTSIFTFCGTYMARNSIDYIAWPRLNYQPMLDAIYYEGPGARTQKGSNARGGGVVQGVHKGDKTILEEAIKVK
ncbi:hypothetical protein FRB90_001653 [Tulasnella sp. 427]|nr:hypothetical protein FRB90_001653 [Tulasnella sp. 427]